MLDSTAQHAAQGKAQNSSPEHDTELPRTADDGPMCTCFDTVAAHVLLGPRTPAGHYERQLLFPAFILEQIQIFVICCLISFLYRYVTLLDKYWRPVNTLTDQDIS